MNGIGADALVTAGNVVVAAAFAGVLWAYSRWVWRLWRTEESREAGPLRLLPFSILWLALWMFISSVYYGAARPLAEWGVVDLWSWIVPVVFLRAMVLYGAVIHLVPIWRAEGVGGAPLCARVVFCAGGLTVLYALVVWALW
jgi:hypothetical protein